MHILGPYIYPSGPNEGRRYVITVDGGKRKQMLYSRWLMQEHLGRELLPDEHVDHIDEDKTNDRLDNLQILSPAANSRKSATGRPSPLKGVEKGWTHGTIYGWMRKKCKCAECTDAKRAWHDARNARRRHARVA